MSIFDVTCATIKRYGCAVILHNNKKSEKTRAFIEPFRYKNKIYVGGAYHRLGINNTEKYLYVGPPENSLEAGVTVIQMQKRKYIVKRCETYYVKDCAVYVWAILQPYGCALEDDYESD